MTDRWDAYYLSACGLLVGLGIITAVWARQKVTTMPHSACRLLGPEVEHDSLTQHDLHEWL